MSYLAARAYEEQLRVDVLSRNSTFKLSTQAKHEAILRLRNVSCQISGSFLRIFFLEKMEISWILGSSNMQRRKI